MSNPWLYALTVAPLSFYLWVLALWHSGRHPRVVSGPADFALLAAGVGGVLVFGPAGQLAARVVFSRPDPLDWLALLSFYGLLACLLARRAIRRLVVYHVDPAILKSALHEALRPVAGSFQPTLTGFEDRHRGRGLTLELTPWLRSAVVETHGHDAEGLLRAIRPALRRGLRQVDAGASPVALVLYGLAIFVISSPLVGLFVTQPRTRAAFRALLERLTGV